MLRYYYLLLDFVTAIGIGRGAGDDQLHDAVAAGPDPGLEQASFLNEEGRFLLGLL